MKTNDKDRIQALEYIVRETLWMARRYAHNRRTYAPSIVNECVDIANKQLNLNILPDTVDDIEMYARDGDLGKWNTEMQRFEREQLCPSKIKQPKLGS